MIKEEKNTGINFFQRYLTVWVFLCMIVGVLLGHFAPALPAFSEYLTNYKETAFLQPGTFL
ncbi:hypothetical protein [Frisingicoccus sp.]|uniref:hypothetical protein n=1 Tax=Frisingicoccus sp. TaxID=1918627 RepID=UPI003736D6B7